MVSSIEDLRLECLKLAAERCSNTSTSYLIAEADLLFAFVQKGEKPAQEPGYYDKND